MALQSHWSRHDRCCWGRTGFQQLGGGAGRAGTCAVYRPLLAGTWAGTWLALHRQYGRAIVRRDGGEPSALFERRPAVRFLHRDSPLTTIRKVDRGTAALSSRGRSDPEPRLPGPGGLQRFTFHENAEPLYLIVLMQFRTENRFHAFSGSRALCSQVESLGVAEMRLKQTDRAVLRFRETVNRSRTRNRRAALRRWPPKVGCACRA